MNTKFKIMLLSLLIIGPTLAVAKTAEPKYCPSIAAIQSVPLTRAMDDKGSWIIYSPGHHSYDTTEEWTYVMIFGDAGIGDKSTAITKANEYMTKIARVVGPDKSSGEKDAWGCWYVGDSGNEFLSLAITPPYEGLPEMAARFK